MTHPADAPVAYRLPSPRPPVFTRIFADPAAGPSCARTALLWGSEALLVESCDRARDNLDLHRAFVARWAGVAGHGARGPVTSSAGPTISFVSPGPGG